MDFSQWIISALLFVAAFLLQRQKDKLRDDYERELRAENVDLRKRIDKCEEVKDELHGDIADLNQQLGVEYGDFNAEERRLKKRKRLEDIRHPPPLTDYEQQQRSDGEVADWAKDDPDGLGEDSPTDPH